MPHDFVIRGGTVVDGTGAPRRTADVAIDHGRISEVGRVGAGREEIDADGLLVTPGFVDPHTHFDGQVSWDPVLAPSSWHGVTTAVLGNCGVGFAPVRPSDHNVLVELMEGVEDIPGTALHEGLDWDWESFPDYLDALERQRRDVDVAARVPHGALRLYVMGERGAAREPATDDEVAEMARLAGEAVEAGALGFTTSRTRNHRTSRGDWTPTLTAAASELAGIADGLGSVGKGVLQVVSDFTDPREELSSVLGMAESSGRPLSISLSQVPTKPEGWRSDTTTTISSPRRRSVLPGWGSRSSTSTPTRSRGWRRRLSGSRTMRCARACRPGSTRSAPSSGGCGITAASGFSDRLI